MRMKRAISVLGGVLLALVAIPPLVWGVSFLLGYRLFLASYPAFAAVLALVAVSAVILCGIARWQVGNAAAVFFALAAPFALLSAVLYLFLCSTAPVAVCMLVTVCACGCLTVRGGKPTALKVLGLIPFFLGIFPAVFFSFVMLLFGDLAENTVVQSVPSPSGAYCAEVISSDQGALGGDTFVEVYKTGVDAGFFRISGAPRRVYRGDWGAYRDLQLSWKNDHCLLINSAECPVEWE